MKRIASPKAVTDAVASFLKPLVIEYVNDMKLLDSCDLYGSEVERMIGERDMHLECLQMLQELD